MSKSLFIASLVASAAGAALGDDSASVLDTFPWAATVPGIDSPNTINGRVPEGTPGSPLSSRIISASTIGEEELLTIAYRDIRSPGSRAPIHVHRYSGATCVDQGTVKVYIEGQEEFIAEAGSCYVMPAMTKIAALNIGEIDVILNDVFRLPCGESTITFIESCCLELNAVDDSFKMYSTSSGRKEECGDDIFHFNPHYEEFSAHQQNITCDDQGTVLSSSGTDNNTSDGKTIGLAMLPIFCFYAFINLIEHFL